MDISDNLAARRIRTQISVLQRIFTIVVIIVAVAFMLMTFPGVRQLGTSLLASAGLAGLILGMAMKSTLSSLIAGLQIALTGPSHIEDVSLSGGEFGWIEEITTTYVVVRTWDLRRLIVPLSYFIEHVFQNWTRQTADLLAYVYLYYVRENLIRFLQEKYPQSLPKTRAEISGQSDDGCPHERASISKSRDNSREPVPQI